ncbi:hypothetical protein [Spirosoma oryzicola]|uniref:hypothetical protein n=1 Tax=Spirosoma oryzicola TaxID=2898794 RepID=UPI001E372F60|nr:hypothetical protein [Spirosoma oryzicola]UHG92489.1 hypothetical protein LQ777_06175 [Spirosoma oryzicola]
MWLVIRRAIDYFDTIPPLILLILAVATLVQLKRNYVIYYIACQFVFNGYANLLNELEIDNLYVYTLNFTWSFFILSLYFIDVYKSPVLARLVLTIVVLFQVISLFHVQEATTEITFNSVSFGIISLLVTGYSLIYYTKQLSGQPKENILGVRDFWYVNGIFTYYASNFFIFLTYNMLVSKHYSNISIIWRVHNFVFLAMCIYIFIGLRCKQSPEKLKSSS